MDNAATIPGYKYFVAPDGTRPEVCVAFLDVHEDDAAWVNGVCVPVDAGTLAALDHRERNYVRIDVSRAIDPAIGPTWAYVGLADSRRRYADAVAAGRCVVASEYVERVERGFRALGERHWEQFAETTDDHRPPLRELRRVDLP